VHRVDKPQYTIVLLVEARTISSKPRGRRVCRAKYLGSCCSGVSPRVPKISIP
jgi:hypothetical protein